MTDLLAPFRRGPWRHLRDLDVWQSLVVAALACAATAGLLWLAWFVYAVRLAARSGVEARRARTLLLFGKRLVDGRPDADYATRIARLHALVVADPSRRVLLLGGAADGGTTEAAAALARLVELGLPPGVAPLCEDASTDTLENLRNARALLGDHAREPVALVSSRYHLARCVLLARSLGFDAEPVAADAHLRWRPRLVLRLALEAGYCLWLDAGTRWARLTGNRRMLDRVT